MARFIGSHLGPTFEERGISAEIFIGTMSNSAGAAKQAVVAVGGKRLQFDMPASGWATINWK
ncbi:hypothetical protein [Sorangium sp. So ce1182]|uniref:hypothetical protein n=1 Tax=Sorangium sp. So ce1182 TaxID=3133334 RepID=UPI003F6446AB